MSIVNLILDTGIQIYVIEDKTSDEKLMQSYGIEGVDIQKGARQGWNETNLPFARFWAKRIGTDTIFAVAVDTTLGPTDRGFIGTNDEVRVAGELTYTVSFAAYIEDLGRVEIEICQLHFTENVEPIEVGFVLDIGNTRTCGLVVEYSQADSPVKMENFFPALFPSARDPFSAPHAIFESTFEFVPPYWESGQGRYVFKGIREHDEAKDKYIRAFGYKPFFSVDWEYTGSLDTFYHNAIAVFGREAIHWRNHTNHINPLETGLSSPKRYLWSSNKSKHSWRYAKEISSNRIYCKNVHGEAFQYIHHDDADYDFSVPNQYFGERIPEHPRYPKRTIMSIYLSEMLSSIYSYVNSVSFRSQTPYPMSPRVISDIVLTFPSAMSDMEKRRYEIQARKAIYLFNSTHPVGESVDQASIHLMWDEGIASQIFYIASKLSYSGEDYRSVLPAGGIIVGTLDFGGGTIDVALSKFERTSRSGEICSNVSMVDGVYIGGDDLIRAIIEIVILPGLKQITSEDKPHKLLQKLFAQKVDSKNRSKRIRLLRGLFIPAAYELLSSLGDGDKDIQISFVNYKECDLLSEMLFGESSENRTKLRARSIEIEDKDVYRVIDICLKPSITSLIDSLYSNTDHIDILLLTGRLSSLDYIKYIVDQHIKETDNVSICQCNKEDSIRRIFHDIYGDSAIDPKVSVVVGAAFALCGEKGIARSGIRYSVNYNNIKRGPFNWGFIDPDTMIFKWGSEDMIFEADNEALDKEISIIRGIHFIGRKLHHNGSNGVAVPIYRLNAPEDDTIIFNRVINDITGEEELTIKSKRRATLELQTSVEANYWLDSGLLKSMEGFSDE